jgi:hypothetical protein
MLAVAFANVPEVLIKMIVDTILFFISYYVQHELIFKVKRG